MREHTKIVTEQVTSPSGITVLLLITVIHFWSDTYSTKTDYHVSEKAHAA